jgi:hypothetical protein
MPIPLRLSAPSLRVLILASGFVALASACGGGNEANPGATSGTGGSGATGGMSASGGAPGTSEGARFLQDYAESVCAMYEPCCESKGLGFDRSGCKDWFQATTRAYFRGEFQPERGAACLQALSEARSADGARCTTVPVFDEATLRDLCREAFATPPRTGEPLGGKCLLAGDCSTDERGTVICSSGTCLLELRGAAGDGPCYVTGANATGPVTEYVRCDAKDDVYCHRGENVCKARVGDGEPCPYPGACDANSLCVGGICRRLPGVGEPCLNGVPGAGGFCAAGSVCDRVTVTCAPGLEEGAACKDSGNCAKGLCLDAKCVDSDFAKNLNCTG